MSGGMIAGMNAGLYQSGRAGAANTSQNNADAARTSDIKPGGENKGVEQPAILGRVRVAWDPQATKLLERELTSMTVLPPSFDDPNKFSGPPGLLPIEFADTVRLLGVCGIHEPQLKMLRKEVEWRAQVRQFSGLMLGYASSFFMGGVAQKLAAEEGYTPEQSFAIGMTVLGCGRQFMASTIRLAALDPAYYVQRREAQGFNTMNLAFDFASSVGFLFFHMIVDTQVEDPAQAGTWRLASGAAAAICGGVATAILLTRKNDSWGPLLHVWVNGSDRALPQGAYSRHHVDSGKAYKKIGLEDEEPKPAFKRNAHAARFIHTLSSLQKKSKCELLGGAAWDLLEGAKRAVGVPGLHAAAGALLTGVLATGASILRLKGEQGAQKVANILLGCWGPTWRFKEYINKKVCGEYQRIPEHEFDKKIRDGAPAGKDDAMEKGEGSRQADRKDSSSSNVHADELIHSDFSTTSRTTVSSSHPTALSSSNESGIPLSQSRSAVENNNAKHG